MGSINFGLIARRYFLLPYWWFWALYAFDQGRSDASLFGVGVVERPYPWGAVCVIWIKLALTLVILYAILRPATFSWSWRRVAAAVAYTTVIGTFGAIALSDQAAEYYVFGDFALATMLGMWGIAFVLLLASAWRRHGR